jgi:DNA-binding transcriptional ArsR family regulator
MKANYHSSLLKGRQKEIDPNAFAAICKALAHPVRVQIISYLKKIDKCLCGDIVDLLPLAQSTVSQHLKLLKEAGLIKGEVEGPKTCYCLDKKMLNKFSEMAASLEKSDSI